jgi:hypothetical protein
VAAIDRKALVDEEIADAMEELRPLIEERDALKAAVDKYVLDKFKASDGLDLPNFKVTKVVGHSRRWNGDKLAKLMPKGLFLRVVNYVPDPVKIDALVKEGKIDRKSIEKAYEETPNNPYVKWTPVSAKRDGSTEAESLAEALA